VLREGGCSCGAVRYRLTSDPLFVHCCHCLKWRTRRAIAGALVTAAALCLEPLARRASVDPIRFRAVWLAEVAAGLALAATVLLRRSSSGVGA
jgi:hypothetical protein